MDASFLPSFLPCFCVSRLSSFVRHGFRASTWPVSIESSWLLFPFSFATHFPVDKKSPRDILILSVNGINLFLLTERPTSDLMNMITTLKKMLKDVESVGIDYAQRYYIRRPSPDLL